MNLKNWAESCHCNLMLMKALIGLSLVHQQKDHAEKSLKLFHDALHLGRAMDSVLSFQKSASEISRLLAIAKNSSRYPYYVNKLLTLHNSETTWPTARSISPP